MTLSFQTPGKKILVHHSFLESKHVGWHSPSFQRSVLPVCLSHSSATCSTGTLDKRGAEESTPGVTELELLGPGPLAQVTQHTFLQSLLCRNYYSAPSRHYSEQGKQQGTMFSKLMFKERGKASERHFGLCDMASFCFEGTNRNV